MKIEFQLTADDFVQAQMAHSANAPIIRAKPGVTGSIVLMILWIAFAALFRLYCPWRQNSRNVDYFFTFVVLPLAPWVLTLTGAGLAWARQAPVSAPWMRGNRIASARLSFWKSWRRPLLAACMLLACAIIVWTNRDVVRGTVATGIGGDALLVVGIITLPSAVFGLWGTLLQKVIARPQARRSWEKQSHLHPPMTVEIDVDGITVASEQYDSAWRWHGLAGSLETPTHFLVYASPAVFHILPKRAFVPVEYLAAMRHLLASTLGRLVAGFPVGAAGGGQIKKSLQAVA